MTVVLYQDGLESSSRYLQQPRVEPGKKAAESTFDVRIEIMGHFSSKYGDVISRSNANQCNVRLGDVEHVKNLCERLSITPSVVLTRTMDSNSIRAEYEII